MIVSSHTWCLSVGYTNAIGVLFFRKEPVDTLILPLSNPTFEESLATYTRDYLPSCQCVVSSQVPHFSEKITRLWSLLHPERKARILANEDLHNLPDIFRVENPISFPKEMGIDILLGLLGAKLVFPQDDVLVVDSGTATTYALMRQGGQIEGAYIAPGWDGFLQNLHDKTQLSAPNTIDTAGLAPPWPKSTTKAIQEGWKCCVLGALQLLRSKEPITSSTKVVATGGNGYLFRTQVDKFDRILIHRAMLHLNAFTQR